MIEETYQAVQSEEEEETNNIEMKTADLSFIVDFNASSFIWKSSNWWFGEFNQGNSDISRHKKLMKKLVPYVLKYVL